MDFDIILLKCSDVAQLNPLYVYNLVQVIKKTLFKLFAQPKALQILGGLYVYFRQIATVTVVSQNVGHVRIFLVPFSVLVDRRTCGQTLSLSLSPKSEKQIITDRQFLKSMLCIKFLYLSYERILNIIPATMRVLPSRKSAERVDYVLPDCREFPLTVICL